MPRILGFHEVKDVQHWLSSPQREEFFGALGVTEIKTYVDPQGSKRVGVTMNVADMEALMGAMQSPAATHAARAKPSAPRQRPVGSGLARLGDREAVRGGGRVGAARSERPHVDDVAAGVQMPERRWRAA